MSMNVIIATLGFDERHVVRSILRLGFGNVVAIELLVPSGGIDERTIKAVDEIKKLASMASVHRINLFEVPVEDFYRAVGAIRKLILEYLDKDIEVTLSLGGGLRVLVVEAYTAALLIPLSRKEKIRIFVDLETSKGFIDFKPMIPIAIQLYPIDRDILKLFKDREVLSLRDVVELIPLPRSTLWKELEKLTSRGYLVKEGALYRLSPLGKLVLYSIIEFES